MFRSPTTDLIVILVIVLLILGPKRLPELMKGIGQGTREFKDSINAKDHDDEKPAITPATAMPDPGAPRAEPAATQSAETGSERRS